MSTQEQQLDRLHHISITLDKHHKRLECIMQVSNTSTPLDHEVLAHAKSEANRALSDWLTLLAENTTTTTGA